MSDEASSSISRDESTGSPPGQVCVQSAHRSSRLTLPRKTFADRRTHGACAVAKVGRHFGPRPVFRSHPLSLSSQEQNQHRPYLTISSPTSLPVLSNKSTSDQDPAARIPHFGTCHAIQWTTLRLGRLHKGLLSPLNREHCVSHKRRPMPLCARNGSWPSLWKSNASICSNTVRQSRRLGATREKSSRFGGATYVVELLPVSHLPRFLSSVQILICGGV